MAHTKPRYQVLAAMVNARQNCDKSGNSEWEKKWFNAIETVVKTAPSGGGFDSGTEIDMDPPKGKLVLETAFHHMNDGGYYDGWTEHTITVLPDLQFGFHLKISGRDRNGIKDYIHDVFSQWLGEQVDEHTGLQAKSA